MKFLYTEAARITWLFDTRLINPRGLSPSVLLNGLKTRYGFAKTPAHAADLENNALVFDQGEFVKASGESIRVKLSVYNDGIIAETASNTDDTQGFLDSLIKWTVDTGFSLPADGMTKIGYVSHVHVLCQTSISAINPKIGLLTKLLESKTRTLDNKPRQFDIGAIHAFTEDATKPLAPAIFKFERKYASSFSENEYISMAPLKTQDHLALLEELEAILNS